MNNKYIIILIFTSLVSFFCGIITLSLYHNGCGFFEYKLKDITATLVPISIAICVTYYLNNQNNNFLKSKEVLIGLINRIESDIVDITKKGTKFISSPSDQDRREILSTFKQVSSNLDILFKSQSHNKRFPDFKNIIQKDYFSFKKSLTDGPFMKRFPQYKDKEKTKFDLCSAKLLSAIHESKLHLYLKS